MIDFFRTFCVVSCVASGIYSFIVYHFFHDTRKNIWFMLLCFAFAIHFHFDYAIYPHMIFDPSKYDGINASVFLASYALVVLGMSTYSESTMGQNLLRSKPLKNVMLLALALTSVAIPERLIPHFYLLLSITSVLCCYGGIKVCVTEMREGDNIAIFPLSAVALFAVTTISDVITSLVGLELVSQRFLTLPLVILSHGVLLTVRYRISQKKSRKLYESLRDTLEIITNSDNALMCTQMKADFLYRTLDLITLKCDEDPLAAEDITISLSKYLRHTLNFQQLTGVVPIANEVELTKSFIAIERERYPFIKFEYHFPNPLPEFQIPPLSIQPLVENAIEHGLSQKGDNAKLTISIIPYKDAYQIDISDNGLGMDEDFCGTLTEQLHDSARIGVYNINDRLVKLFGKGLVVQSAPGVGTSISFVVPPTPKTSEEKEVTE